nr:hypothetical protein [Shimia thalassica]
MQRDANLVLGATTGTNEIYVFIGQGVVPKQQRLIRWKVEKGRALSRGQDRSVCHGDRLSVRGGSSKL